MQNIVANNSIVKLIIWHFCHIICVGLFMAKKQLVKDHDKFIVRLPPGMRDRIRLQSERMGISMNEAVVNCLEQYFPRPASLEERVEHLAELVAALKDGSDLEERIDDIATEIDTTLRDIYFDKLSVTVGFAEKVARHVEAWESEREQERVRFGFYGDIDDDVSNGVEEPQSESGPFPDLLDDDKKS